MPRLSAQGAVGRPTLCSRDDYARYLAALQLQRTDARAYMGYDTTAYAAPALRRIQSDFVQTQMMAQERYFYDPAMRLYAVDRYLDDLTARYGRIDSVLIWPTYPNLGIDDRNQYYDLSEQKCR